MGEIYETKLIISGDNKGALTSFSQVQGAIKDTSGTMQSMSSKMKEHWLGISAAALGAYAAISKAGEYMAMGMKAMQAEESFSAVTRSMNINGDAMLSKMEEVSQGMIDESDLMQKAVQGLMYGLDDKKVIGLLEASRSAAKVWGQDVGTTFETLITAVGGGVRAMGPLVRMGLITKEEFQLMNKAIENGADDLDVYQVVMARAALQTAMLGNAELDALEKSQKLHAQIIDLKETLGKGLVTATQYALGGFQSMAAGALFAYEGIVRLLSGYASMERAIAKAVGNKGDVATWDAKIKDLDAKAQAAYLAAQALTKQAEANTGRGDLRKDDSAERQHKAAEAQKTIDAFDAKLRALAHTGKDAGDKLATAMDAFESKVEALNPELDEFEKRMADIYNAAFKVGKEGGSPLWIQEQIDKAAAYIKAEGAKKMEEAYFQMQRTFLKDLQDAQRAEFEVTPEENAKIRADAEADHERRLRNLRAVTEAEINLEMSLVDVYEKLHALDPSEALKRRIGYTEQLITAEEGWRGEAIPGTLEYYQWQEKIIESRKRLLDLNQQLREREGTFWEGMSEQAERYAAAMETDYQRGMKVTEAGISSLENRFGEFFDYQNENWLNFGTLAKGVINDVYKELIKLYVTKPLVNSITGGGGGGGGFMGLIGNIFGGGGGGFMPSGVPLMSDAGSGIEWFDLGGIFHRGGLVMHKGGYVPRFHMGGLSSDEVPAILQRGEGVLSRKGIAALDALNSGRNMGGQPPTIINHITIQATDADSFRAQAWRIKEDFAAMFSAMARDNHPMRRTR